MKMNGQLTNGAIKKLLSGEYSAADTPVLQVLQMKHIASGGSSNARYRLVISDGFYSTTSAMLATQLNPLVERGEFKINTIFRVERHIVNTVQTKKILIILNLEVLIDGDDVGPIGNPQMYDPNAPLQNGVASASMANLAMNNSSAYRGVGKSSAPVGTIPISNLSPYQNKWTVCVRVTGKSDLRTYSNAKGPGKLFSCDLVDQSGEIRATAFNEQCDKFFDLLEVDKVYYISQAQLKTADKRFNTLKNDFEMTFNQATQICRCEDAVNVPSIKFDFHNIDQIEQMEKDSVTDIIGVCKSTGDLETVTQKTTGKELRKKDLQLVDQTGKEIRLTIWATQAERFDGSLNPIVAAKGVKVSDFNGKSLTTLGSTTLQMNPDIRECHMLRAWYDSIGASMDTVNLSNQRSSSGGLLSQFMPMCEAEATKLGCDDQSGYYTTKAMPTLIKQENCLYPACPSENCNKKVIDMNNGIYRCEKCNKEYDSFNWRIIIQALWTDGTGAAWATCFQDEAEKILGVTANELGYWKENDQPRFQNVFSNAVFKEYLVKFRAKMETYNEERRLKTLVQSVQPLDRTAYNKLLSEEIKKLQM